MQTDRLQVKGVNKIAYADQYPGATADAQITAALAAVGSGGTVDARGYGATTQTIAATLTIRSGQTVLFDVATQFQAASSTLNLFVIQPDAAVKGFTFNTNNQPSYSGILFQNDQTKVYGNGTRTCVDDITILASAVTTGTALQLKSTALASGVAFWSLKHWRVWGLQDGVFITTASNGYINGNQFLDWVVSNSSRAGFHITGVASGSVQGNVFNSCSFEKDSIGVNGVLIDGSGGNIDGNLWIGQIWDTTSNPPINITHTTASKNVFIGRFDGTYSDVNNLNNIWNFDPTSTSGTLSVKNAQVKVLGSGSSVDTLDIFDITNAAATPHKYLRVSSGQLQVVNNAFSTVLLGLGDNGNLALAGLVQGTGFVATAAAPTVSASQVGLGSTTATSATTGSNGAVPAQVAGYLIINVAGTTQKIPFYNN